MRQQEFASWQPDEGSQGHGCRPPMSALILRMDDNVVRVAVGLRLGVSLCQLHQCHQCGTEVDHLGLHGLTPGALGHLVCIWEKARWGNRVALEVWSGPGMGCNMPRYLCPLTSGPCCQGGRCGCNPSRAAKDRKVRPPQC